MVHIKAEDILQDPTKTTEILAAEFPIKQYLNTEFNVSTNRFSEIPKPPPETVQIFVLGPSIHGKTRILEYFANHSLEIPGQKNISLAYELNGLMLKGVDVHLKFWHIGHVERSLNVLKYLYKIFKTSFMLIYDVNDFTTFDDVRQWIPSLRRVLDDNVKIMLVGYEDLSEIETFKTLPISFLDGVKLRAYFELESFYEFSDMTGTGVSELFFEAAHIALEKEKTSPISELLEMEEMDYSN